MTKETEQPIALVVDNHSDIPEGAAGLPAQSASPPESESLSVADLFERAEKRFLKSQGEQLPRKKKRPQLTSKSIAHLIDVFSEKTNKDDSKEPLEEEEQSPQTSSDDFITDENGLRTPELPTATNSNEIPGQFDDQSLATANQQNTRTEDEVTLSSFLPEPNDIPPIGNVQETTPEKVQKVTETPVLLIKPGLQRQKRLAPFTQKLLPPSLYYKGEKILRTSRLVAGLCLASLLSLPAIILIGLPIVGCLIALGASFFTPTNAGDHLGAFALFSDPYALLTFANSLIIAGSVGLLVPVSVVVMSFLGLYKLPYATVFDTLSSLALITPLLAFSVMVYSLIRLLGLEPSLLSLIIGHYLYVLPISAIAIAHGRKLLTPDLIGAAEDLYATPSMIIRRVALPLLSRSITIAFHLSVTLSLTDIMIGHLLSENEPLTFGAYLFRLWLLGANEQVTLGIFLLLVIGLIMSLPALYQLFHVPFPYISRRKKKSSNTKVR